MAAAARGASSRPRRQRRCDPDGQPVLGGATPFVVEAAGRTWYANCAWDAFGICAALHADGRIETECADCGERVAIDVRDRQPDDASLLFHCLVPARHWWEDIVYT